MLRFTPCLVLGLIGSAVGSSLLAADFQRDVVPFLKQHCYECHDKENAKAGFQVDDLTDDFLSGDTADRWHEVINQMNIGEMPPEKKPQPNPDQAFAVVEWVGAKLLQAERDARMAGGRILIRRLNRQEYANTVGDLFKTDANFVTKLKEELPADGKAEGFDRISSALFFDQTQMNQYLEVAELIAKEVIQDAPSTPKTYVWEPKRRPESPTTRVTSASSRDKMIPSGVGYYEPKGNGFVAWTGHSNSDRAELAGIPHGSGPSLTALVREDGYYRIKVKGGAFTGFRETPIQLHLTYAAGTPIEEKFVMEIKGSIESPEISELLVFLRAGTPDQVAGLKLAWNGITDVRLPNPDLQALVRTRKKLTGDKAAAALAGNKEEEARIAKELDQALAELDSFDGPHNLFNEKYKIETLPRIYIDHITVEGPITQQWPPESHAAIGLSDDTPATLNGAKSVFTHLLPRAYRRPALPQEVDRLLKVVDDGMKLYEMDFKQALRLGLQTLLVSPAFTYLHEPTVTAKGEVGGARPLNSFEVANRLSYFLWSSMPDDALFQLAAADQLRDASQIREQAKRMLADPKARRFVENFAGQWLDVQQFGSVEPAAEYKDYDKSLANASKEEPLAFFETVLRENLPVTTFLDSDFLTINERLARFYGIEGVQGPEFRKVALKPQHNRGGVLGMAGLLTYLADGTRTLPVRRGAWVLEKLLCDPPPPPPPNAGEIQPNTAGKKLSVRERLALHRDEPSCASCHAKLDPYGLALENYDAIGAWRIKQNGEGFNPNKAPEIDPSGTLKSGREFTDLASYKGALVAEKGAFVKALTEHLLTYALGRPVGYIDQETIQWVTDVSVKGEDRLQTLILAVASSQPFLSK